MCMSVKNPLLVLFGAKPLSEPMMDRINSTVEKQILVEFENAFENYVCRMAVISWWMLH